MSGTEHKLCISKHFGHHFKISTICAELQKFVSRKKKANKKLIKTKITDIGRRSFGGDCAAALAVQPKMQPKNLRAI